MKKPCRRNKLESIADVLFAVIAFEEQAVVIEQTDGAREEIVIGK